jgi:Protein of unknown function (DUF1573)
MKTRVFLAFIFLSGGQLALAGALDWPQSRVELKPATGDKEAVAYFVFTNKGTQSVEIKSASSSCSTCTELVWEQKAYKPGEEGQLIAKVDLKGINGRTTKILTVTTSENPAVSQRLELVLELPEKLTLSARSTRWDRGSMEAKTVTITTAIPKAEPYLKEVKPEGLFTVALTRAQQAEGSYQIQLTPVGELEASKRAIIKVGVRDAEGTEYLSTITATRR